MTAPKCTSWLGHKFEARFDIKPYPGANFLRASADATVKVINAQATRTYVRDVCVRCGATIERGGT
jgi:hypothetical protein